MEVNTFAAAKQMSKKHFFAEVFLWWKFCAGPQWSCVESGGVLFHRWICDNMGGSCRR
jgi:hypothetical protein